MCNCVCLLQDKEQARAVRAQRVAQAQQEREEKGAAADDWERGREAEEWEGVTLCGSAEPD